MYMWVPLDESIRYLFLACMHARTKLPRRKRRERKQEETEIIIYMYVVSGSCIQVVPTYSSSVYIQVYMYVGGAVGK